MKINNKQRLARLILEKHKQYQQAKITKEQFIQEALEEVIMLAKLIQNEKEPR